MIFVYFIRFLWDSSALLHGMNPPRRSNMTEKFNLKRDVLQKGRCTLCGACLDWCPYLKNLEDHLVMPFDCLAREGRCLAVCPCVSTDWEGLKKRFFPEQEMDPDLGHLSGIHKVRAAKPPGRHQDGGTASALLVYGLEAGLAGAALLTRSRDGLTPEPFWAKNREDVEKAAGSRYFAAAGLRLLNGCERPAGVPLVVVGRPCQIRALRKMQVYEEGQNLYQPVFAIGLFCTWQLAWSFGDYLAAEYPGKSVRRIAIPRNGLEVDFGEGPCPIPMDVVRAHTRSSCHHCSDMSAELADISVGSFEQKEGWNTLVVRSEAGRNWLEGARSRGDLLVEEYPENERLRLKHAAQNKAQRALGADRPEPAQG